MMVIDNKFNHGDIVFLATDPDQYPRLITGITIKPNGLLLYQLSINMQTSWHYDFEVTASKDVLKPLL